MKPNMIFFDRNFVLKITREKGTSIWDISTSFLKWMLERCEMSANLGPLERDVIQAFIDARARMRELYLQKEQQKQNNEVVEKTQEEAFFAQAGLPPPGVDAPLSAAEPLPPPPWEDAASWYGGDES